MNVLYQGHNAVTSSMEVCQGSSHEPNSSSTQSSVLTSGHSLLTSGVAWTIGLSHPDSIGQNLVPYSFHPQEDISYLLYRFNELDSILFLMYLESICSSL